MSTINKMKFKDKLYVSHWHSIISQFRSERELCDVTLVVEGQEYPVHKLVLSSFSPYFRAMFNCRSPFIESKQDKVSLPEFDRGALEAILNFMYTSCIEIDENNIYPLMDMVNLMQIHPLRCFIRFYLDTSLDVNNCLIFYEMANFYQYLDSAKKAFTFVLLNYSKVMWTEEYLNIPFEMLHKIVSSRLLDVNSEDKLVEGIFRWIDHDTETRKDHVELLLSKLFIEELSSVCLSELKSNSLVPPEIKEDIIEVENSRLDDPEIIPKRDKMLLFKGIRYKLQRDVIFAIGGETSGKATVSVECYTKGYNKWKSFIPICVFKNCLEQPSRTVPPLKIARFQAACTTDGYNKIFVIGGQNTPYLLDQCEVYDLRTNEWEFLKNYPEKLCGTGAACMDNKLYVAGGFTETGAMDKVRLMSLDAEIQMWKEIPPMTEARYFHALIAVGGYIFAIGGYGLQGIALRTCERYDSGTNKWVSIADMREARAKFGCTVLNEFIYVFGGTTYECDSLKSVEKYNVLTDEWITATPMPLPRQCLSSAIYENDIYCIGGTNSVYALDCVDKFSLRTKRWHWEESLQCVRISPCTATLKVPLIVD